MEILLSKGRRTAAVVQVKGLVTGSKQCWSTSAHFYNCRHTIKCLRDSRWPAATRRIVKDFARIERSVERLYVTDVGEGPSRRGAISDVIDPCRTPTPKINST